MTDIHDIPDEDLRRGDIGCTILCWMDFATNPQRWWLGYGVLTAGGQEYKGVGDSIQITALDLTYGMSAGMVRFSIPNASAEMIARCDNQEAEVNNRTCQLFYQLFSTAERPGDPRGRLIGNPVSMFVGKMRDMTSTSSFDRRDIELEAYGRLSRQGKPPFGRWTDNDQRRRHPGDTGFGLMPSFKDKAIVWVPGR